MVCEPGRPALPGKRAQDRRRTLQRDYVPGMPCHNNTIREGRVHLRLSVCREKGGGISGPLHQVQLVTWATRVPPSQAGGQEAALPLSPFATTSVSCLAGGREKKGRRSHVATDLVMLPNEAPCQGRFPLALKRFRCLPLRYEVSPLRSEGMPAAATVQKDKQHRGAAQPSQPNPSYFIKKSNTEFGRSMESSSLIPELDILSRRFLYEIRIRVF